MNRKILLMILFSFAAHMAVAAVIVYLPSSMGTNETSGYQEKVMWGYFSGRKHVKGMRQSGIIADNILSKGRSNSSEKVNLTEAHIKYNQNDPDSNISKRLTEGDENAIPAQAGIQTDGLIPDSNFRRNDMQSGALSGELSANASDYSPLPGGSTDSGDGTCQTSSQCGSNEVPTNMGGSGDYNIQTVIEYVRKEIERHKYYPNIAKLKGIEGTVYINFNIGQEGTPAGIAIARSSGSKILDDAGVKTVRMVGEITNLHKELRELDIVVPITYKLEK